MNTRTRTARAFRPDFDRCESLLLLSTTPLSPALIKQAYSENFNFLVGGRSYAANGAGQTIAIVMEGADPTITNDLANFDRSFGLAAPPSLRIATFSGAQVDRGAIPETSMDIEWAHAVAPAANLLLVQAASWRESDMVAAVNYARQQPGVSVVSMSWGWHESSADLPYTSYFTTPAGHTGVTFVAASGDTGAWTHPQGNSTQLQFGVAWPASNPNVLSVGGTSLAINAYGNYVGESTWNNGPGVGGGGGRSTLYAEPSYQRGVQSTGSRTVPDVAYDADAQASPIWIYDSYDGWQLEGGTSAGAPQWAGLIAIADQGRALVGLNPLDGVSQTMPALYQSSSTFHDVTLGSNGYYYAGRGYDLATGLGSPIANQLIGNLSFHVTSNYVPSRASMAVTSGFGTTAGQGSVPGGSFAALATTPIGRSARPAPRPQAGSTSDEGSLLIALTPNVRPNSVSRPDARRGGLHDLALDSLLGETDDVGAI